MLAVVGDLIEDVVVWPAGALRSGTDNKADIYRTRGGSAANVAAFAASRYATRFIGCVGDDAIGEHLSRLLEADGVDIRLQRKGTSGTIVILIEPDGERTMLPNRGAATQLEQIPADWLSGVELLHVPAYSFDGSPLRETVESMIVTVRKQGGAISIDTSSTQVIESFGAAAFLDYIEELRPEYLIANNDEADLLGLGVGSDVEPILRRLWDTTVVLKAGANPTRILRVGRDALVIPVPPVALVRDSTGAGDAFAAGFLASLLLTGDLKEAAVGGHASAALVLASPGATAGIPAIS
ncbi:MULTISPECIES: carbohydrate kinase family protein [unclassified Rathayibacter]|uniref:carbohydrate kinase family protein n=1 Tax=unclassified Rathayibacter TaxID=2609250 RepID=UPI000CE8FB57|nr:MULTISPECIES: PfkB family carbohydrate kinase [unclassified Rathayibacter]PPG04767.1 hypothetical protein C5C26_13555 [Rathayibacter sp. AY2B1]PPG68464.1 hypothetical protein C5C59_12785 [Rathayibacter sp. AY1F4]